MKMILIVEDNTDINNMIYDYLCKKQFECVQAFSGTEALLYLNSSDFDIIILDLMLPGINGNELIEKVKPEIKTPIIILSAKDELDTKVNSLMLGADDYITKPFELEELYARISVQLRKTSQQAPSKCEKYKDLVLSKQKHTIMVKGYDLNLTRQEFKILELLLSKPDKVFSKQNLYESIWQEPFARDNDVINTHISNLRKKLKGEGCRIKTIWGLGYRFAK